MACNAYGKVFTIGLCHGVQHTHALLAKALKIPAKELDYVCAGINHMTWFIKLQYKGEDMTGRVVEAMQSDPEIRSREPLRIDIAKRFGYFCTESNGHLSEYIPWYRKTPEEMKNWLSLSSWIGGETGGYLASVRSSAIG
jgi:alpha-galactosidase